MDEPKFQTSSRLYIVQGFKVFLKNILELLAFASPVQTSYSVADEQVAIEDDPHLQNYNQAKLRYKKSESGDTNYPHMQNYNLAK